MFTQTVMDDRPSESPGLASLSQGFAKVLVEMQFVKIQV